MPVLPNSGPGLGAAILSGVAAYQGAKRQTREDDLFEQQLAAAKYAQATQRAQNESQGLHITAPGEPLPRDVSQNITDYAAARGNAATPNNVINSQISFSPEGGAPTLSRAGAGAANTPGAPASFVDRLRAMTGSGPVDRGPQYQIGKGYYIDKAPQWQAADAAQSAKMSDQFEGLLANKMMAQQERDAKVQRYVAAGIPQQRAELYVDNPNLAENDPRYGKPSNDTDRTPRSFTVNGTPTEGFADKLGNFYDSNGKRVTGAIAPFVHPLAPGAVDSTKRFGADQANKILDDYARDTKDFHQVMGGWDVLTGAVKDPSLATPFAVTDAYARITNPGAIVRPTTMEMIHQMGSVGQRMEKFWSQNKDGALPPDILRDFQKTLYNIVSEHKKQFDQIRTKAVQRGKDAGVDVTPYLEDYTVNDPSAPKVPAVGGGRVRDPGGDINLGDTSVNPFSTLIPKKKP